MGINRAAPKGKAGHALWKPPPCGVHGGGRERSSCMSGGSEAREGRWSGPELEAVQRTAAVRKCQGGGRGARLISGR